MKKTDKQLGMDRDITRRDFIHDLGVATVGLGLASRGWAGPMTDSVYPPTLTGMRGSQPGSYEVAHALRGGARIDGGQALDEEYDLVVVGSGLSWSSLLLEVTAGGAAGGGAFAPRSFTAFRIFSRWPSVVIPISFRSS